jgi:two-component system, cell cycle response regulator
MTSSSILIVDSDPSARQNFDNLLHNCPYQTHLVTSEEDARQHLDTQKVDIVIADLQTLGPAGLPFLAYTRSLRTIPDLVFITSENTLGTAIEALKAGAREYLLKPCPPEQVFHLINSCIDQRRLLDENFLLKRQIRLYHRGQSIASLIDIDRLFALTISTLINELGQGRGFAFLATEKDISKIDGNEGVNFEEALTLAQALLPALAEIEQMRIFKGDDLSPLLLPGGPKEIKTLCVFPLRCEKNVKGGLVVINPHFGDFLPAFPVDNLIFLAEQATLSFENAFRFQGARELIYTDDLTGLYNYRYLQKVLDLEIRRSERYKLSFSLVFIDLDRFKSVNDTRGHLIGSDVLRECADILRKCVRDVDILFRYGGDEFTILLVEASAAGAAIVAERIRATFEGFHFQQESGAPLRLTATIGYATYPENASDKKTILEMADRAMYFGKTQRNIVRGVWEIDPS